MQHVAEAREAREHAARRRVREHRDERRARVVQVLDRGDRLRHLHQREDPLLHARAAGRRDRDERDAALDRAVARARELLADDAAHRAAHEREVHHRELAARARRSSPGRSPSRRRGRSSARPPRAAPCTGAGRRTTSGSSERSSAASSTNEPGSASCSIRLRAGTGKWWPQWRADVQRRLELVVAVVRVALRAGVRMPLRRSARAARPRCSIETSIWSAISASLDRGGHGRAASRRPFARLTGRMPTDS